MTARQLKKSILQMAIRGKLVSQDPAEAPADVWLERIGREEGGFPQNTGSAAENGRKQPSRIFRGADGLFYQQEKNRKPVCVTKEIPFEIPESWAWARLGWIGEWGVGGTPDRSHPEYYQGEIPWVKTGDLKDGYLECVSEHISEAALEDTPGRLWPAGTVLVAMYGATMGRLGILTVPAAVNQACCACLSKPGLSREYLFYFLMSQRDAFVKQGEGGAQSNISKEKIVRTLIPLPPEEEQRRIAAHLNAVWPLLRQLEQAEASQMKLDQEFPGRLERSVLREAIRGRLVCQIPSEEPASLLLDRIRKKKEELVRAGNIRREKQETVIFRRDNSYYEKQDGQERCIDGEIPFQIPESWAWARLGSLVVNRDAERIPLSAKQRSGMERRYDYYGASGVIDQVEDFLFHSPLLLVSEDGANLLLRNKPVAFVAKGEYWVNNHVHALEPIDELQMEYMALFLNAISLTPYITGAVQPKLNRKHLDAILVAVPPAPEQRRIVERVEEIRMLLKEMKPLDV